MTSIDSATAVISERKRSGIVYFIRRNPTLVLGLTVLAAIIGMALAAPWFTLDPQATNPSDRLLPPFGTHLLGTDHLGRDIFARTVHGARISLLVGASVAVSAVSIGLLLGLLAGYFRMVDAVLMRLMDGLMSIPAILLAIALVALSKASALIVIIAITIPEIPRVVRLVRAVVLSVRERPFVDAAISGGTRVPTILARHILPSTIPPLIVQATYIAASAILVEAALSFLGAGTPPDIPTWGNMIAQSRLYLSRAPWTIFAPGVALAIVVLAINLVGDGLRDHLDPRLARRM
jgi:peptide/nickel transport system permease protein